MTPTTPLWYSEADACGMYAQEQLAAEIIRAVTDASASDADELQSLNEAMWLTENEPSHKRIGAQLDADLLDYLDLKRTEADARF